MKNLNKENFFDKIRNEFPKASDHFWNWFKEYQKEVKWNSMFVENYFPQDGGVCPTVHFWYIPVEMQVGIITRYLVEQIPENEREEDDNINVLIEITKESFIDFLKNYEQNETVS